MSGLGYSKIIVKLDKVNIIDIIKTNSFSQEEEHNVEIILQNKSEELLVYKSPTVYVNERNYGELLIEVNEDYSRDRVLIRNNEVKWSIKGNWCEYIVLKINELELEIKSKKSKLETVQIKTIEEHNREASDKEKKFNNLFREN